MNRELSTAEVHAKCMGHYEEASERYPEIPRVPVTISPRMAATAGRAFHEPGEVKMSHLFFKDPSREDQLRDTFLHELAHIAAGPGKGHGPEWKEWCLRLGARPERLHKMGRADGDSMVCAECGYSGLFDPWCLKQVRLGLRHYKHTGCGGRMEIPEGESSVKPAKQSPAPVPKTKKPQKKVKTFWSATVPGLTPEQKKRQYRPKYLTTYNPAPKKRPVPPAGTPKRLEMLKRQLANGAETRQNFVGKSPIQDWVITATDGHRAILEKGSGELFENSIFEIHDEDIGWRRWLTAEEATEVWYGIRFCQSLGTPDKDCPLRLVDGPDGLEVKARLDGDELSHRVGGPGPDTTFRFNARYLSDVIFKGQGITITCKKYQVPTDGSQILPWTVAFIEPRELGDTSSWAWAARSSSPSSSKRKRQLKMGSSTPWRCSQLEA